MSKAKPTEVAIAFNANFKVGRFLPSSIKLFLPLPHIKYLLYGFVLFFLVILRGLFTKKNGSSIRKVILKIIF
tara:strand:+ start:935 stop:1153 length:219 start_codon:yes stop_codon:yes gene_type:complete